MHNYTIMDTRSQRLQAIRQLIRQHQIRNQEELLSLLQQQGYDLTQATVSRDLKSLRVGKRMDAAKGGILFLPEDLTPEEDTSPIDSGMLTSAIRSVRFANRFGIIKTLPGYASSVAIMVDRSGHHEIAGTIAGDDTILVIPGQDMDHGDLKKALNMVFPHLDKHLFYE